MLQFGTQDKQFDRLIIEIERLIESGIIKEKVVAQVGVSKYRPKLDSDKIQVKDFTSPEEMKYFMENADLVITHGGVATIIEALNNGKKIIAVPRLKKYKEHVNDHQLQIIESFNQKGYIIGTNGVEDIQEALNKAKDFTVKKYESNNKNFLEKLENCINTLDK